MKIAYCLNSIRYLGGIQRVTIVKANALAKIPGYEIYVIVTDNRNGVSMGELDSNVRLIDLNVNYYEDDWKSKYHVLKGIFIKRHEHLKKLRTTLEQIQPDIVVSVGQSEKNMITKIKGPWKTIREFHFVSDYRKRHAHSIFQKILAWGGDFHDRHITLRKYDRIVVLTYEDQQNNWQGWRNVSVIPNPKTFTSESTTNYQQPIIISCGRLNSQKNYKDLIETFKFVSDQHPDWQLHIYGEGEQRSLLESLVKSLKLEGKVFLKGYTNDIPPVLLQSSIAAYTSLYEGFPLSIIEAMECGVPVISYKCPCGPCEIISDQENGFLVDIGDTKKMAEIICNLIDKPQLLAETGKKAKERADEFSVDHITARWMRLFEKLKCEIH